MGPLWDIVGYFMGPTWAALKGPILFWPRGLSGSHVG
jgi:hypothetical protein